ncbi:TIM barrel protein [Metaclostridioides mangenotii]|uniref:Sugar phosphate isomerase/epimerase n=1 Tax=Metaclostridioides mangenotii TaxID=1540 RepID=A0ABS4ECB7_9FIRM|nr:TIM barrel protein [Clostridioides mangenotii]MBP1855588.1 sugar phosphate isomerase/epimerase [Clostridioides mangenotii]
MKLGISSLVQDIDFALNFCEKYSKINHLEVGVDCIEDCKKLYTYIDRIYNLGLSIGIHLPMELNACEEVEYIRRSWIHFLHNVDRELKDLDIEYYNLHLGYAITGRLGKNKIKFLENCIDFLDNLNIDSKITLENTYSKGGDISNIGTTSIDFEYIFKGIKKSGVFFCFDTGHNLINESDYIEKLEKNIKLIHLSDNDGVDDLHIGIGKGLLSDKDIKKSIEVDPEYLILEVRKEDLIYTMERIHCFI